METGDIIVNILGRRGDISMDKYIKVLCEQNPTLDLDCDNPKCNHKTNVKSKDFFKSNIYKFTCSKCELKNEVNSKKWVDDFIKTMKDSDITAS